jgi:putative N6-adenine-specific DNA methylase
MTKFRENERQPELFVTCGQGLEPLLVDELTQMGFERITAGFRGVYVADTSLEAIYQINYCSRIASRVLLPLHRFRCHDRQMLYRGAETINWLQYIPAGKTFAIDANVSHRELRNSLFAAQVVKDAICDHFRDHSRERPNVNPHSPDIQLNLFIYHDMATLSFDTSGDSLHKRGYRQDSVEAPIRENLAAALLRLAQFRGDEILYDPCCGSGTFLVEAALIASQTAPGFLRRQWGFMSLPNFSQERWLQVKCAVDAKRIALPAHHIFGTDLNKNAVHVSKVNLRAAGFHLSVEVSQRDFREYIPTLTPNFMICNPPHGYRLEETASLKPLYRSLGDWMKQRMAKPSRAFLFTGNLELAKEVGLAATQRHVVDNGGVDSRLLELEIY